MDLSARMATEMVAAQLTRQHAAMDGNPRAVVAADHWLQVIQVTGEHLTKPELPLANARRRAIELLRRFEGVN
jgi:hypothetical protein